MGTVRAGILFLIFCLYLLPALVRRLELRGVAYIISSSDIIREDVRWLLRLCVVHERASKSKRTMSITRKIRSLVIPRGASDPVIRKDVRRILSLQTQRAFLRESTGKLRDTPD